MQTAAARSARLIALGTSLWLLAAPKLYGEAPAASAPLPPVVAQAEKVFFAAFGEGTPAPSDAIGILTGAYTAAPSHGRTNLLLGLAHLWQATENQSSLAGLDHLMLSERFLARAAKLLPNDGRIPSWLVPVRLALAGIERDHAAQGQVMGELLEAFRKDPAFHSFSVAMLAFPAPRGSERFQQGLAAINAADGCDKTNPSCQNQPRWAHNMESFETFRADYELKAGNTQKARAILASVKTIPGYSEWPYKAAVEERLANLDERAALFANADPKDDPALLVVGKGSCGSCHRSR